MAVQPLAVLRPINFTFRSPYSFNSPQGLPPGYRPQGVDVTLDAQGNPVVMNQTLQHFENNAQASQTPVSPVYDTGKYGDAQIIPVTFNAAGLPIDQNGNPVTFILPRPNNTRTSLLVVNSTVLGNVYYNFDQAADPIYSVPIAAGGSRNWADTVPQGNLSLYSSGAGVIVIEYTNNNIS